jgi:hypothetical protein
MYFSHRPSLQLRFNGVYNLLDIDITLAIVKIQGVTSSNSGLKHLVFGNILFLFLLQIVCSI